VGSRRRWAAAAAAVVVVAGCALGVAFRDEAGCRLPLVECRETGGELFVRNDRADPVTVRAGTGEVTVPAGQTRALGGLGCGGAALVAVDAAGAELATLAPADECATRTWIFEAGGTARVIPGNRQN
jgi:hypothetical protein